MALDSGQLQGQFFTDLPIAQPPAHGLEDYSFHGGEPLGNLLRSRPVLPLAMAVGLADQEVQIVLLRHLSRAGIMVSLLPLPSLRRGIAAPFPVGLQDLLPLAAVAGIEADIMAAASHQKGLNDCLEHGASASAALLLSQDSSEK